MKSDLAGPAHGLMCRMPGCGNAWTVDCRNGKVCSFHDEQLFRGGVTPPAARPPAQQAVPFREVARPFAEVDDDRDAPEF